VSARPGPQNLGELGGGAPVLRGDDGVDDLAGAQAEGPPGGEEGDQRLHDTS
jgi:hypothetical protein